MIIEDIVGIKLEIRTYSQLSLGKNSNRVLVNVHINQLLGINIINIYIISNMGSFYAPLLKHTR